MLTWRVDVYAGHGRLPSIWDFGRVRLWRREQVEEERLCGDCLLTGRSVLTARFVPAVAAFGGVSDIRVHNY